MCRPLNVPSSSLSTGCRCNVGFENFVGDYVREGKRRRRKRVLGNGHILLVIVMRYLHCDDHGLEGCRWLEGFLVHSISW